MKQIKKLEDVGTHIMKAKKRPVEIRYCIVRDRCYVQTREGKIVADTADVIIEGVKGEVYPCARDIFHETYDLVD